MQLRRASCYLLAIVSLGIFAFPDGVTAQISSDGTLSTTVSTDDAVNFLIENGDRVGNNLFHSFSEFSIPNLGSAYFDNATDITNIFSRVTGGNISDIQGLIRANGTANLFLINPAGIVFGENASLDVGGSFFATTAESVVFGDGIEFSATQPQEAPLLTINITPGLQMGSNSSSITVQGTGYTIATENPFIVTSFGGLRVTSGNTLALIGGEITLDGGLIAADSGFIELASVTEGLVNLNQTSQGWQFDYEAVPSFGNVQFLALALADISGTGSGSINVRGENIYLRGGSRIFRQSQGLESGGEINLTASDSVEITGTDGDTGELGSVIQTETIGGGKASDIVISSQNLLLSQGSGINSRTFSPAQGGDITINVVDSVTLKEFSPIDPTNGSDLTTSSFGVGNAGDLSISTQLLTIEGQQLLSVGINSGDGGNVNLFVDQLRLIDGGLVSSSVVGSGNGGDVNVEAQSIELIGINFNNFTASAISASTIGTGNAGNLTINTGELILQDGGRVDASTFNSGLAGSITVNASESVEVSGMVLGSVNPSLISSSANILDEFLRQSLGLPDFPSGDSGNVSINTPVLTVTDGAQVTVRNDGTGNAGFLQINGESIFLNNGAGITASTQSGEGGNINLQIQDNLLMRNGSSISTEAGGIGNGGNISINSDLVTLLEGSQIKANAFEGNGGNITITTQGLFVTPNSSITATSQFGVDGVVEINTPDEENKLAVAELPADTTDASEQIAEGCEWTNDNTFYITGRSGIAKTPQEHIQDYTMWSDIRDLSGHQSSVVSHPSGSQSLMGETPKTALSHQSSLRQERIVEANAWIINERGNVELVAIVPNNNQNLGQVASSCSGEVGS